MANNGTPQPSAGARRRGAERPELLVQYNPIHLERLIFINIARIQLLSNHNCPIFLVIYIVKNTPYIHMCYGTLW